MSEVTIFTDGACLGNPGPGGWAAIVRDGSGEKTIAGGFRRTTNNRMEICAVVNALCPLPAGRLVTLVTDSQYVCNAVEKRWLAGWRRNGWRTSAKTPVKNRDLWERLLPLLERHTVRFRWIRGHSGHPENERCDEMARGFAGRPDLPVDEGFLQFEADGAHSA